MVKNVAKNKLKIKNKVKQHSVQAVGQKHWLLVFPLCLCACFFAVWLALAPANFLYSTWYELAGMEKFIDLYAPQNRHKDGFLETSKQERIRLFSVISDEINSGGEGLAEIAYYGEGGKRIDTLLHRREVVHLEYVANIVSVFKLIGLATLLSMLAYLYWIWKKGIEAPSIKNTFIVYSTIAATLGLAFVVVGPKNVFTFMHEMAFPEGHQWFFYYQDSLMTTLMMAPDLFAYIAAVWVGLSLMLFVVIVYGTLKLFSLKR